MVPGPLACRHVQADHDRREGPAAGVLIGQWKIQLHPDYITILIYGELRQLVKIIKKIEKKIGTRSPGTPACPS